MVKSGVFVEADVVEIQAAEVSNINTTDIAAAILAFLGLPAALIGFFFWLVQRRITKRDKQKEALQEAKEQREKERDERQENMQMLMMQSIRACVILSTATAKAVQRIPDAKCNGDMTKALEDVAKIQAQQKSYVMKLGLHAIYEHDVNYDVD